MQLGQELAKVAHLQKLWWHYNLSRNGCRLWPVRARPPQLSWCAKVRGTPRDRTSGTLSVPQLRSYNTNFVQQQYQLMDPVILTGFKPRRRRFYASRS